MAAELPEHDDYENNPGEGGRVSLPTWTEQGGGGEIHCSHYFFCARTSLPRGSRLPCMQRGAPARGHPGARARPAVPRSACVVPGQALLQCPCLRRGFDSCHNAEGWAPGRSSVRESTEYAMSNSSGRPFGRCRALQWFSTCAAGVRAEGGAVACRASRNSQRSIGRTIRRRGPVCRSP